MANGRPNKEPGYCDYQFEDGTYCKERIEKAFKFPNGDIISSGNWADKENRNFCLFHSHNDKKDEFFFPDIKKLIRKANDSARNKYVVLNQKKLPKEKYKKEITKIKNDEIIDFEGFYFPTNTNFITEIFEIVVSFKNTVFSDDADFSRCIFLGEVMFNNAHFVKDANYISTKFTKKVNFINTLFDGDANFENARFRGVTDFQLAKFNGYGSFLNAKFYNCTDFSLAIFRGPIIFFNVDFKYETYFINVNFQEKAVFHSAKFSELVDFSMVIFSGEVQFNGTRFLGGAYFDNSKFLGDAYFERSLFLNWVGFTYSSFSQILDCTDAAFLLGKLDFTRSKFPNKNVLFHNTIFNCEVLFHEQMLKGVRFTGCYLGSSSFYGSDVRDAVFINSSWNRKFLERQVQKLIEQKRIEKIIPVLEISRNTPGSNRGAILLDELIYSNSKTMNVFEKRKIWISFGFLLSYRGIQKNLRNFLKKQEQTYLPCYNLEPSRIELDPLYLEHLYCQFKLAMDRNKMYGLANDFYYGEKQMETKRLREEHSYLKWAFLWLYRLLAGFGNSPWKAIFSLIIILFASSGLLIILNGLTAVNPIEAYERCPCERNEAKPAVANQKNLKSPSPSTKAGKSYISTLLYNSLAPLNALNQSIKPPQSAKAPAKVPQKKEAGYSLKSNYLCNIFFVSLWNLTASPGRRSGDYKENGILAYLAVFFIQYVFRPLMVALIIISVRRKVYRG